MIKLNVNGRDHELDIPADSSLLWVLRDHLNLKGAKYGCGVGECGACTVHVDGRAERSCTLTVREVQDAGITTIEGLPADHPVKAAWEKEQVVQCGFCQPGIIMQAAALLDETPTPRAEEIIDSMDDVICRCGTHVRIKKGIIAAVELAGRKG
ncbi:MAG: (2Fe-2S)-binding protein [Pseudomonadota bacterium]